MNTWKMWALWSAAAIAWACSGAGDDDASTGDGDGHLGGSQGDGDSMGDGDGDGDGTPTGDGDDDDDGNSAGDGDGDGDATGGDGDGDATGGDGDGDAAGDGDTIGDGDGDSGGDGDGDGDDSPGLPGDDGEVLAFPGARGFAAAITGGRGGQVLKVTTLAATGPGSLAEALDTPGPRIIVFAVSGVIETDLLEIPYGDVTIAGQSAPGAGITINGRLWGAYEYGVDNIVIRHLRVRPSYDGSAGEQFDALRFSLNRYVLLDHVSASFGVDETVDLYEAQDITVQWSVIESAGDEGHPEGEHNYGLINGPDGGRVSILNSVFAHNKNRNPALANGPAELVSNVLYNVRHGFVHHNPATGPFHFIGNYFMPGPEDELIPFFFDDESHGADESLQYYFLGNYVSAAGSVCDEGAVDNPWQQCDVNPYVPESHRVTASFDFSAESDAYRAPGHASALDTWSDVLKYAGAYPHDEVSKRTLSEALAGTGAWGGREPGDLLAGLTPGPAPGDSDDDGIPDSWEESHDLDPKLSDSGETMASGYTAIEEYLNELAQDLRP